MGVVAGQTASEQAQAEDFSLVLGGPFYRLLLRYKLIEPPLGHLAWRIGVITAVAWLPLLLLTIASGRFAGNSELPFVFDCEAQARILLALPLLILAEYLVYERMRTLTVQFVERQIVTERLQPAFNAAVSSAKRLTNSLLAEIVLLLLVVLMSRYFWTGTLSSTANAWYGITEHSHLNFTAAGDWYVLVSIPVFQFVLLRWYYRIAIWCRFLFQVSRLDLNLTALHPDRCCGLGFLGNVVFSFAPLLMAQSFVIAGYIANHILWGGMALRNYAFELVGFAAVLLVIVLGPLCVFAPKLWFAKIAGLRTYGAFASHYVVGFASKWIRFKNIEDDDLLGSADIQSLADLANSFAVVREAKLVPFGKDTIIAFLVVIALPLLPLAFTMFSPEEILRRLIQVLF